MTELDPKHMEAVLQGLKQSWKTTFRPEDAPYLLHIINDEKGETSVLAAACLIRISESLSSEAVAPLINAIRYGDHMLAKEAGYVLKNMRTRESEEALVALIYGGVEITNDPVRRLNQMDLPEARILAKMRYYTVRSQKPEFTLEAVEMAFLKVFAYTKKWLGDSQLERSLDNVLRDYAQMVEDKIGSRYDRSKFGERHGRVVEFYRKAKALIGDSHVDIERIFIKQTCFAVTDIVPSEPNGWEERKAFGKLAKRYCSDCYEALEAVLENATGNDESMETVHKMMKHLDRAKAADMRRRIDGYWRNRSNVDAVKKLEECGINVTLEQMERIRDFVAGKNAGIWGIELHLAIIALAILEKNELEMAKDRLFGSENAETISGVMGMVFETLDSVPNGRKYLAKMMLERLCSAGMFTKSSLASWGGGGKEATKSTCFEFYLKLVAEERTAAVKLIFDRHTFMERIMKSRHAPLSGMHQMPRRTIA